MAEEQDKSSKTEEPTSKRVNEAFKEGRFAQAPEIAVVFGLVASFVLILFLGAKIGYKLAVFMSTLLGGLGDYVLKPDMVVMNARGTVYAAAGLLAPIMLTVVVFSILAGGLQSGFKLTPKVLKFRPEKLNPVTGFKQKFGKEALVKFGIDLLKMLVIGGIILFGIVRVTWDPIFHTRIDAIQVASFIMETTLYLLSLLIGALGAIALINYLYQRYKIHESLKMTKQEVKDEHKQQEGDPMVKNARRQMARAIAQRQMFEAVPNADVIVTNPTHYAIALRYDRLQDAAPMVLAKGKNLIAQRIKEIGRQNGVPIVENKPLARGLFKIAKAGQPIPQEFFKVVAEVLAYVYRSHRSYFAEKNRRRAQERAG